MTTGPRPSTIRARVALVTALSLGAAPLEPLFAQAPATSAAKPATSTAKPGTSTAQPAPVGSKPATAASPTVAAAADPDGGWPKNFTTAAGAALVVYQPQVASWERQRHAVLFSAVSYMPKGATQPFLGTVKVESDTSVALDERLVSIGSSRSPSRTSRSCRRIRCATSSPRSAAVPPSRGRGDALDRVLANIDTSQIIPKNVEGVKADPPPIFFSKTPAVLVNVDGEPIWSLDPGQRPQVRGQHELGSLPARADRHVVLARQRHVAEGAGDRGPVDVRRARCPTASSKLPSDRELERGRRSALPGKKLAPARPRRSSSARRQRN